MRLYESAHLATEDISSAALLHHNVNVTNKGTWACDTFLHTEQSPLVKPYFQWSSNSSLGRSGKLYLFPFLPRILLPVWRLNPVIIWLQTHFLNSGTEMECKVIFGDMPGGDLQLQTTEMSISADWISILFHSWLHVSTPIGASSCSISQSHIRLNK